MSEVDSAGVPFVGDDESERRLWKDLNDLPKSTPSPRLRRRFYDELEKSETRIRGSRWSRWLGLSGAPGLFTALSCAVAGLMVGLLVRTPASADRAQLSELRQQVTILNRNLILDRLDNDSASKRLLGVIEAGGVAAHDEDVARALLARAVEDRVYSVRSAAIDAIGPRLSVPTVGHELMASLEKAESPLVQLALVDLVLRHGTAAQLEQLIRLSERNALHPDVVQHIKASVLKNTA
jgi:hypothetical protein